MKFSFDKIKNQLKKIEFAEAKERTKEVVTRYYKVVGSCIVVASLCVACIVTAVGRMEEKNQMSGVMMTLSDVASDKPAFSGREFEVAGLTYNQMMSVSFETEQLAQLEKSERQYDGVLSSNNQDKRDQAAMKELTAQNSIQTTPVAAVETTPVVTQPETTPVYAPSTAPTYADETGTYEYVGEFTLTGYCPCPICCGAYSNMTNPITASGTTATAGRTIAADTSVFPFGTQLVINGQIYTVEDRGGAIRGNKIDIFFASHQEALVFGKKTASVYRKVN